MNLISAFRKLTDNRNAVANKPDEASKEETINYEDQILNTIFQYRADSKKIREAMKQKILDEPDLSVKQQKENALKKIEDAKSFVRKSGLDQSLLNIFLQTRLNPFLLKEVGATDINKNDEGINKINFTFNSEKISFVIGEQEIAGSGMFDDGYNYNFKVLVNKNEVFNITFNKEIDDFGDSKWIFFEPYKFLNGKWVEDIIEIDEQLNLLETKKELEYKVKSDLNKIEEAKRFSL